MSPPDVQISWLYHFVMRAIVCCLFFLELRQRKWEYEMKPLEKDI